MGVVITTNQDTVKQPTWKKGARGPQEDLQEVSQIPRNIIQ